MKIGTTQKPKPPDSTTQRGWSLLNAIVKRTCFEGLEIGLKQTN